MVGGSVVEPFAYQAVKLTAAGNVLRLEADGEDGSTVAELTAEVGGDVMVYLCSERLRCFSNVVKRHNICFGFQGPSEPFQIDIEGLDGVYIGMPMTLK